MAELVPAIHVFVVERPLGRHGCPRPARAWRPNDDLEPSLDRIPVRSEHVGCAKSPCETEAAGTASNGDFCARGRPLVSAAVGTPRDNDVSCRPRAQNRRRSRAGCSTVPGRFCTPYDTAIRCDRNLVEGVDSLKVSRCSTSGASGDFCRAVKRLPAPCNHGAGRTLRTGRGRMPFPIRSARSGPSTRSGRSTGSGR